jgi:hypothetical protein
VPLAARVVEVIADLGNDQTPRYRYGSGCIVLGRTVLTAAHVVADAQVVQVRRPDRALRPAQIDRRFVGSEAGPDLALIDIDDNTIDLEPIKLAVVDRDNRTGGLVERCHVVGYPQFTEKPSPSAARDTVDVIGVIPVLSNLTTGLLSVQVTVAPRELPSQETSLGSSEWSGMSGAPVIASGCLLGVVSERAPRQGPSTLTTVPLTALQADPAHKEWGPGVADPAAWWSRLGVEGADRLQRLPVPQSTQLDPAYVTFYISYRRDQSSFIARSLRSVLASRLGEANVFMDTAAISPDQELPRESQVAILDCRVMLVIIGHTGLWRGNPDPARGGWMIPRIGFGGRWSRVSPARNWPSSRFSSMERSCPATMICRRAFDR